MFCVFLCLFIMDRVTFCVFGVFSLVCFELSVPVQVIAWKDSSPKDLSCVERDVKLYLLTHSLTVNTCSDDICSCRTAV